MAVLERSWPLSRPGIGVASARGSKFSHRGHPNKPLAGSEGARGEGGGVCGRRRLTPREADADFAERMSETTLRKLQADNQRLQEELQVLSNASTTMDACRMLVTYMTENDEPFTSNRPNQWQQTAGDQLCCILS